jgi:acyl-CoA thioester hydrolase
MDGTEDPRASPTFTMELTVDASVIDELGHASNIAYVRWVQDVAKRHSECVGWDHERYKTLGAVFVVRKYELDYVGSALLGDRLRLETYVESWSAASSVRKTRIFRASDDKVLFHASTLWALVSITTGRPTRIPAEIRDAFARVPITLG